MNAQLTISDNSPASGGGVLFAAKLLRSHER